MSIDKDYETCLDVKVELQKESSILEEFLGEINDPTESEWKKHWKGMPAFECEENSPFRTMLVHFRNKEDVDKFIDMFPEQAISDKTKYMWYPAYEKNKNTVFRWIDEDQT